MSTASAATSVRSYQAMHRRSAESFRGGTSVLPDHRHRPLVAVMAPSFQPGWDVLIIARPAIVEADHDALVGALRKLLDQGRRARRTHGVKWLGIGLIGSIGSCSPGCPQSCRYDPVARATRSRPSRRSDSSRAAGSAPSGSRDASHGAGAAMTPFASEWCTRAERLASHAAPGSPVPPAGARRPLRRGMRRRRRPAASGSGSGTDAHPDPAAGAGQAGWRPDQPARLAVHADLPDDVHHPGRRLPVPPRISGSRRPSAGRSSR